MTHSITLTAKRCVGHAEQGHRIPSRRPTVKFAALYQVIMGAIDFYQQELVGILHRVQRYTLTRLSVGRRWAADGKAIYIPSSCISNAPDSFLGSIAFVSEIVLAMSHVNLMGSVPYPDEREGPHFPRTADSPEFAMTARRSWMTCRTQSDRTDTVRRFTDSNSGNTELK